MTINWNPGLVWLEHTGENAISDAAIAATAVLGAASTTGLTGVNWGSVGSVAGYAALLAVLRSLAALRVSNGTDSFLPKVVAKPDPLK